MEYARLGSTGLVVSRMSYGSWVSFKTQVDVVAAHELMLHAFKAGINLFDNAEAYAAGESERIMGEAVKMGIEKGDWARSDLVLTTKLFMGTKSGPNDTGLSRKHIVEGIRASLARSQLEYFDVVFCHRQDPFTPIEETVRAMSHIIERGWALYWGTSEWTAQAITQACEIADRLHLIRPCCEQPEYNLVRRDRVELEYAPLYETYGLGLTTWSPLMSGVLTGKYSGMQFPEGTRLALPEFQWLRKLFEQRPDLFAKADKLVEIADKVGCSRAQLAIAWVLKNPKVSTVLLGATSVAQLDENLAAMAVSKKLTPELMKEIDALMPAPLPDRITLAARSTRKYLNH